ncbi:MAG TPA: hypothetical protein VMW88_03360 [Thermoplasmata archaeon]|jgi:hypothetical protein|nr:hypothetical protein [Thermoplasmata archaeon]
MERKFESELAKKVAGGNKDNSSKRKGVLFAAVATCALLFGSAAFSIAEADNDNGTPVTVLRLVPDAIDEIVAASSIDGEADVKRTMNLKARSFAPEGDSGCVDYTKILYTVSVRVIDPDVSVLESGMMVGKLTIDYAYSGLDGTPSMTVAVDGIDLVALSDCVEVGGDDDGKTVVTISLPDADYSAVSTVYFNVGVKIPEAFWTGDIADYPWSDEFGIFEPNTVDWTDKSWPTT